MKKIISFFSSFAMILSSALFISAAPVFADSVSVNFENPPYTLGVINGQDGWSALGSAGSGCALYDHAVSGSLSTAGFGAQSLRISNAVTSGCFGDQTFSKSLLNEAGETTATNAGLSGGTRQQHFEAQWDIVSSVPGAQQPGLFMSVSPDRGDGARMSYLGIEDKAEGLLVIFYDVQQPLPCVPSRCANFVGTDVASGLDRSILHTLKLSMDFVDGPSNDVVRVYVDGVLVHTGGSWEDYFRNDPEAIADQNTHTVDSLIFRTGGPAVPTTAGNGFLVDNLSLLSGPILVGPPTKFSQCKGDGWKTFNNPTFTSKSKCKKYVKDHMHTIKGNDIKYTAGNLKREADFNMSTAEDGSFEYDDAAKGWYNAKVFTVRVNGNIGWFAAKVVKASNPAWVNLWVFGKVEDNEKPTPDRVWGSFTDQATAEAGVAAGSDPGDGPFTVTKGNIKVK